jgi:paraquat-inducible protein B
MVEFQATLKSSQGLIGQIDSQLLPEAARTLKYAQQALESANAVLAQDAPLQKDVQAALRQVGQSARALAALADYLERHPEALIRGKPEDPK